MENYEPITSFGEDAAEVYDDDSQRGDTLATVAFLEQLAGGGPALELAIGTGRVALPLAARGIRVNGIDISPAMVAVKPIIEPFPTPPSNVWNGVPVRHASPPIFTMRP